MHRYPDLILFFNTTTQGYAGTGSAMSEIVPVAGDY